MNNDTSHLGRRY